MKLKNKFFALGVFVTLVLAGVVSYYASGDPDGLEKVAEEKGFLADATDHGLGDSPLADYGVSGIADDRLSVALAGIIGVFLMLALSTLMFKFLAKRK
jgi:cobalt/nickel transport protein